MGVSGKEGGLPCAGAFGAAPLGLVASCYGHGVWGLLPHHAVTLPLPPDQSVPADGIVPSKNLCHLFKERYRLPHAGYRPRAGSVQFVGSIVKTIFKLPPSHVIPPPQISPLNDTLAALPVHVALCHPSVDQPVPETLPVKSADISILVKFPSVVVNVPPPSILGIFASCILQAVKVTPSIVIGLLLYPVIALAFHVTVMVAGVTVTVQFPLTPLPSLASA